MNELIAFLVLGGPLFPFIIWIIICALLVKYLVKPKGSSIQRSKKKLLIFIVVALLPFTDALLGQIYFEYLCSNDAGVEVLQTVELPAEYWDANGKLTILNKYGNFDREFWLKNIDESKMRTERYSSIFNIVKNVRYVAYKQNGAVLGKRTTFQNRGGWFSNYFSINNSSVTCQSLQKPGITYKYYSSLFKPAK
jgi:hypothetical protein